MYKILFKGKDIEPIFVDDSKGKQVWDVWVNDSKARMVINNTAFFTGDIKQISKIEKSEAETAPKVQQDVENDYLQFRKNMLALPIEKRASILRIPKMIWTVYTKKEMPEEVKQEIKNRQLAYFKENPKCIYANPKVYKDLMATFIPQSEMESFKPAHNVVVRSTLRIIESMIQTDLTYSAR